MYIYNLTFTERKTNYTNCKMCECVNINTIYSLNDLQLKFKLHLIKKIYIYTITQSSELSKYLIYVITCMYKKILVSKKHVMLFAIIATENTILTVLL